MWYVIQSLGLFRRLYLDRERVAAPLCVPSLIEAIMKAALGVRTMEKVWPLVHIVVLGMCACPMQLSTGLGHCGWLFAGSEQGVVLY